MKRFNYLSAAMRSFIFRYRVIRLTDYNLLRHVTRSLLYWLLLFIAALYYFKSVRYFLLLCHRWLVVYYLDEKMNWFVLLKMLFVGAIIINIYAPKTYLCIKTLQKNNIIIYLIFWAHDDDHHERVERFTNSSNWLIYTEFSRV